MLCYELLIDGLLALFALHRCSLFRLDLLIKAGDDRFDLVAQEKFALRVCNELYAQAAAQLTHQSSFVGNCLQAAKFLLLRRQFMPELGPSDLLHLLIDIAWGEIEEARWDQSMQTRSEDRLGKNVINLELFLLAHELLVLSEKNLRH